MTSHSDMKEDLLFSVGIAAIVVGGIALIGSLIVVANYIHNMQTLECYSLLKDKPVSDILLACKGH